MHFIIFQQFLLISRKHLTEILNPPSNLHKKFPISCELFIHPSFLCVNRFQHIGLLIIKLCFQNYILDPFLFSLTINFIHATLTLTETLFFTNNFTIYDHCLDFLAAENG